MTSLSKSQLRKTALITGLCYIILMITGPIGLLLMPENIFVADNAGQTVKNLITNPNMFFLGIGAQIVIFLTEIILSCLLYVLTRPVSRLIALTALAARLTMTVVIAINILPLLGAYHMANGDYAALPGGELSLVMFNLHIFGTWLWQFAFALHLVLLGFLIFNSTYLPRLIGLALSIGGVGYVLDSLGHLVGWMHLPTYTFVANGLLGVAGIGEISLALWVLIKGVHVEKWNMKSLAS